MCVLAMFGTNNRRSHLSVSSPSVPYKGHQDMMMIKPVRQRQKLLKMVILKVTKLNPIY